MEQGDGNQGEGMDSMECDMLEGGILNWCLNYKNTISCLKQKKITPMSAGWLVSSIGNVSILNSLNSSVF